MTFFLLGVLLATCALAGFFGGLYILERIFPS